MDTSTENRKEFINDKIMIVAYSDEFFMYKGLLGTHGQYKITKGVADFMKISPKENISAEDKKDFIEYLELYKVFQENENNDEKIKSQTYNMLKSRYPERYKEIIEKSEKYLFGIANERTEEDKLLNPVVESSKIDEEPSYNEYKMIRFFEDFIQEEGKNIKGLDKQIKEYIKMEKIDMTVEEFKQLRNKVLEWDKNRK